MDFLYNRVTDEFVPLLSMPIVAGRGFSRQDDGAGTDPVLINRKLAQAIFGDADPVGQVIAEKPDPREHRDPAAPPPRQKRVIGVMGT